MTGNTPSFFTETNSSVAFRTDLAKVYSKAKCVFRMDAAYMYRPRRF